MKLVSAAAALVALVAAGASRGESSLTWEEAFDTRGAPANVHFRGTYTDLRNQEHRFEVWRRGVTQLVRNTDDRLIMHADRGLDGEYVYKLVDKARNLVIDVREENLHRLGRFSDWTSLSTMLQKPQEAHRIIDEGRSQTTAVGACRWFRIESGNRAQEICWARMWGLPLVMRESESRAGFRFKIDAADRDPKQAAFRLDDAGLIPIHADDDIHPSSD